MVPTFIAMAREHLALAKAAQALGNTGDEAAALRDTIDALDAAERHMEHDAAAEMSNSQALETMIAKVKASPGIRAALRKALRDGGLIT